MPCIARISPLPWERLFIARTCVGFRMSTLFSFLANTLSLFLRLLFFFFFWLALPFCREGVCVCLDDFDATRRRFFFCSFFEAGFIKNLCGCFVSDGSDGSFF
jgi:hypothetical protein